MSREYVKATFCQGLLGGRSRKVVIAGLVIFHFTSVSVCALSFIMPLDAVERRGIKPEASELKQYLKANAPETTLLLPSTSDSLRDPWELNSMIALALGDLKAKDAVPILQALIAEPIPKKLDAALTAYAASQIAWDAEPIDWDRLRGEGLIKFRGDCAVALAKLDAKESTSNIESFIDSLVPLFSTWWADPRNPPHDALWGFSFACKAASALGSKRGVDAMIAMLPLVRPHSSDVVLSQLRIVTEQTIGPEYGMPARDHPAEIQKWVEWWKTNRADFACRPEVIEIWKTPNAQLRNDTLMERLLTAHKRLFDFDGTSGGKAQASWLDENADDHIDELARIIEDPAMNYYARREAIDWYAKFAGTQALPVLTKCMTLEIGHDPEDAQLAEFLMCAARDAINKYMPEEMDKAIQACVAKGPDVAMYFGPECVKDEATAELIAERFSKYSSASQLGIVQFMRNAPRAPAMSVFLQAIRQHADAWVAMYGMQGIGKLSAEAELNPESRDALVRWQQDPFFALLVLQSREESVPPPKAISDIAARVKGNDARALRIHHSLFVWLGHLMSGDRVQQQDYEKLATIRSEMWKYLTQDIASLGRAELLDMPVPPLKSSSESQRVSQK